jgi:hypothetical protein
MKEKFKQKRETVVNQEQLIKNLADSVQRHVQAGNKDRGGEDANDLVIESKNRQYEAESIRFQKEQLFQKLK